MISSYHKSFGITTIKPESIPLSLNCLDRPVLVCNTYLFFYFDWSGGYIGFEKWQQYQDNWYGRSLRPTTVSWSNSSEEAMLRFSSAKRRTISATLTPTSTLVKIQSSFAFSCLSIGYFWYWNWPCCFVYFLSELEMCLLYIKNMITTYLLKNIFLWNLKIKLYVLCFQALMSRSFWLGFRSCKQEDSDHPASWQGSRCCFGHHQDQEAEQA